MPLNLNVRLLSSYREMAIDRTQSDVVKGIAVAAIVTIAAFLIAYLWQWRVWQVEVSTAKRLKIASLAALAATSTLIVSVARLARHRFVTPQDIQGSAVTSGTEQAKLLQALLQNTLEQTVVAAPVYFSASLLFPPEMLAGVVAAAALFISGRVLFFAGYHKGAGSRAVGFGLTFYPTVILFVATVVCSLLHREA